VIFYENLEQVPEEFRADFVESEFEGKKGFQHKKVVALANAYKSEHEESRKLKDVLAEQEKIKAAAIEQARKDALEEAKKAQNFEEYDKRHKEILEDARNRAIEEGRNAYAKELAAERAKERKANIVEKLSNKAVSESAKKAMAVILERMIDINPETGAETILDLSGKATAITLDSIGSEIGKMDVFENLIAKELPTSNAGGANGYSGANGAAINAKGQDAKQKGDLTGFIKAQLST